MHEILALIRDNLRYVHIVVGFIGLAAFWIPVAAKKGGKAHVVAGKFFEWAAYIVTGTAFINCLILLHRGLSSGQSISETRTEYGFVIFLGYLSLVTFATARQGVKVLRYKKEPRKVGSPAHLALAWICLFGTLGVVAFALIYRSGVTPVLLALSPIGFLMWQGVMRYHKLALDPPPRIWFYEHMSAMIGTGIAFHTAFAVFGAARLFNLNLTGPFAFVPWILPALIGVPAAALWEKHYRKKFGDLPAKAKKGLAEPGST